MASLIHVPIDWRTPEQTGIAGNSFWSVLSGTASQLAGWMFLGNTSGGSGTGIRATAGVIYGIVNVPPNVDPNSTGSILVCLATTATANAISFWKVHTREVLTGSTYDVTSFVAINGQAWTAPTTGWARKDLSFARDAATTGGAQIMVKLERNISYSGAVSASGSGVDDSTALVMMMDAYLVITATA